MVNFMRSLAFFVFAFVITQGRDIEPELERRKQRDTVGDEDDHVGNTDRYDCDRRCAEHEPMTCYYRFVLEPYFTMGAACGSCPNITSDCLRPQCVTADGYERGILTVNRRLPGPSIQVCQGDRIVVDVHNKMPGRTTTIHWHGILQRGTPFMDGVPMVTQCPVISHSTFRYNFIASNPGTHFWHSHDGLQMLDGISGSLIVRPPYSFEPDYYDYDKTSHVILVADWMNSVGDQKFPGGRGRDPGQEPVSYLINGRGRLPLPVNKVENVSSTLGSATCMPTIYPSPIQRSIDINIPFSIVERDNSHVSPSQSPPTLPPPVPKVPYAEFIVTQGYNYRFRLIGAMSLHCPAQMSIEKHRMRLIATDAMLIEPVYVDKLVFSSGERYDFVLEAVEEVDTYWIHVKGLALCEASGAHQVALLKYTDSDNEVPSSPHPGYHGFSTDQGVPVTLNPLGFSCGRDVSDAICTDQLTSLEPANPRLLGQPDVRLLFEFDFNAYQSEEFFLPGSYRHFLQPMNVPEVVGGYINNISHIPPPSPLLTQLSDIPPEMFCESEPDGHARCSNPGPCECVHLVKVPRDSVVELVFADLMAEADRFHHPFHLHGHAMHIMATSRTPPDLRGRDLLEELTRLPPSRNNPEAGWFAAKDTVGVPSGGYVRARFIAHNPGYWMVHCHYIYHFLVGMSFIIEVGDHSQMAMPPAPFQKCGDFVPPVQFRRGG